MNRYLTYFAAFLLSSLVAALLIGRFLHEADDGEDDECS